MNELKIKPRLDELTKLYRFANNMKLPDKVTLALEEVVINVINYSTATRLSVDCRPTQDSVTLTVTDDGIPFNPLSYPLPTKASKQLCVGGQGINLIRSLMDKVEYQRKDNLNILTLTKHISNEVQV